MRNNREYYFLESYNNDVSKWIPHGDYHKEIGFKTKFTRPEAEAFYQELKSNGYKVRLMRYSEYYRNLRFLIKETE